MANRTRIRNRKPLSLRVRNFLGGLGWYTVLIAFGLVTVVPFLWTALMSVRPNSANVFSTSRPPAGDSVPGIDWLGRRPAHRTTRRQLYRVARPSKPTRKPALWVVA